MNELTPIYRIEYFLDAIVNGSVCPYEPIYRVEYYLAQLAGADVTIPEPIYRVEFYLAKLCGMDVEIPDPIYRIEFYLAKACGMDVEVPDPIYRVEYWLNEMAGGGTDTYTTFTGSLIQFTAPKAHAFKSFSFTIEPQQSGSGDPSPDNVRPISGWNSATVTGAGVNLWDEQWEVGDLNASGANATANDRIRSKNHIPVAPGTTYYIAAPYGVWFWGYDESKTFVQRVPNTSSYNNQTITVPSGIYYLRFVVRSNYGTTYNNDISINYPSTDTAYHASSVRSLTLNFPSTVYGGTAVWNGDGTWTVTVDRAYADMGEKNYLYRNGCFDVTISGGKLKSYSSGEAKAICSSYKQVAKTYSFLTDGEMCFGSGYVNGSTCSAIFKNTQYTDAASFKTAMSGVQLVYELATPQTITVTTETLFNALKGENNIWTDTGDTTLEAIGEAIELNALQSLNILLGGRYVNNHTADDVSDEEALNILLGGNDR